MKLWVPRSVQDMFGNYATISLLITMLIHGGVHISDNKNGSIIIISSGSPISSILIEEMKKQNYTLFPYRNKIKLHESPTPSCEQAESMGPSNTFTGWSIPRNPS